MLSSKTERLFFLVTFVCACICPIVANSFLAENFQGCFRRSGFNHYNRRCRSALVKYKLRTQKTFAMTENEWSWLWKLTQEVQHDLMYGSRGRRAVRRECRVLTQEERHRLFTAINVLKRETARPNAYETIAKLHIPDVVEKHAHRGPNFLAWHRVLILHYERALQRIDPSVSLCYWDSRMEYRMGHREWTQTTVFSHSLFGNCKGKVYTGPFKDWTLSGSVSRFLHRNVGGIGSPVDPKAITMMLQSPKFRNHSSVTVGGHGRVTITNHIGEKRRVAIEIEHNNVHAWVGREMGNIALSTEDPVFFFHHSFVDYIWEKFKQKLRHLGVDPEYDYPNGGHYSHNPSFPMYGFDWLTNAGGYSDLFTDRLYTYEDSPGCSDGSQCNASPYLHCNDANECVASKLDDMEFGQMVIIAQKLGLSNDAFIFPGKNFTAFSNWD